MSQHEIYMQRCLQLAMSAEGLTYPNPMVGCVIVHEGKIIGEGYHRKAGEGHAEVNAIASVRNKELLKNSTLYVSLEPCSHYGKTPPCSKLIIEMGIPKVVVGCIDSFSAVSGRGISMLRNAGIEVTVGILEKECRYLNRRFFTFNEKRRPYVILKWAESSDGFIGKVGQAVWLTNEACKRLVHKQRTTEPAILIGANTAINDNPSLTARLFAGNNPTRFVVDPHLRTSDLLNIMNDDNRTIILNSQKDEDCGNVKYVYVDFNNGVNAILSAIYNEGAQSVIIEGGTKTLQPFIDANIWDEAYIYKSQISLNDGIKAPIFMHSAQQQHQIDNVSLFVHYNA
ncbi:MAG: bifunctional diaminohydroxyphosphoribosylaminopyrimidine deaminase/5-amino-6-(5-phosphoribosylamino)uracil reductase RibD [Bacteroidales bacterium]|nr:bifunctional diaminohydroxyphosphoribosylaminopyrimidine deaminase/5-amino-6-(5-phosphoribosylamino)uracil reductase RibD [Bacteroidales bacterium]